MSSRSRVIAAATAASLIVQVAVRADDYPQWRGPNRTAVSRETGLLKEWPKEGPKLLWKVKDLGFGYGTPAVSRGRIYLISNSGMDNEYVQALDAKNGTRIWQTKIGVVGEPKQNPSYPGARSTPTVEGDRLYVFGSDGDLVCLETADGKVVWSKNVRKEFGGQPGIWAYSESPLVDGDTLVCTPGGAQATVLAVNKKSGDVIWKYVSPNEEKAAYASIVATQIGGVKQYVQFLAKSLVGLDARTGKRLWSYDKTAEPRMGANIPTPVAFDGHVYSASSLIGGGLARIKGDGDSFQAEEVYFAKKMPAAIGGTVLVGDYLYGTGSQALTCLDFKTGVVKWEERCVGPGAILYADGRLYVKGENGEIAMVEATSEGYREKGRFTPPEQPEHTRDKAWSYPVLANGKLYLHDLGTMWCYDVKGK